MKFFRKILKKFDTGFTLIELMIVIAIVGILSSVTIWTSLSGLPERRVMDASRRLYSGIQKARSFAIRRGESITITFSTVANSYTTTDSLGTILETFNFPGFINLFSVTGDSVAGADNYIYNSRGIKTGILGSVSLQYINWTAGQRRWLVRVTPAGGVSIQDF
jgi:prepilin-type N-terminal cleavage/methylation domain-containing protein